MIVAAITTGETRGQVYWATSDGSGFEAERMLTFPIVGDGMSRTYKIDLSSAAGYRGGITRLRIDPAEGAPGSIELHAVHFER